MSTPHFHKNRQPKNGSTHQTKRGKKAPGRNGSFAASVGGSAASFTNKGKSFTSKAEERKQRKTDLTGKEIAKKWKEGRLANLTDIVGSLSRQIVVLIEKKANLMFDLFLEIEEICHPIQHQSEE